MTHETDAADAGDANWQADKARALKLARGSAQVAAAAAQPIALLAIAGALCWLALEVRQVGDSISYISDRDTADAVANLASEVEEASKRLEPPPPAPRPSPLDNWFDR